MKKLYICDKCNHLFMGDMGCEPHECCVCGAHERYVYYIADVRDIGETSPPTPLHCGEGKSNSQVGRCTPGN